MLTIKYDSNYKEVFDEIIDCINKKLNKYTIYNGKINENEGVLNISEDTPSPKTNKNPYTLLSYTNMTNRLKLMNNENPLINNKNSDDYYYVLLHCPNSLDDKFKNLNQIEKGLILKSLDDEGLYLNFLNDKAIFIIGLHKNIIK